MLTEQIRSKLCEKVIHRDLDEAEFEWDGDPALLLVRKLNAMQHSLEVLHRADPAYVTPAEIREQIWSTFREEAPEWLSKEFVRVLEHTRAKLTTFMQCKYDQIEHTLRHSCASAEQAKDLVDKFFS